MSQSDTGRGIQVPADQQQVVGFTPGDADRIAEVVRRVEALPASRAGVPDKLAGIVRPPVQQWVQITSTTRDANGRYPGLWYRRDVIAKTWTAQAAAILVETASTNDTLTTGVRYRAYAAGEVAGVMVFCVDDSTTSNISFITALQVDGLDVTLAGGTTYNDSDLTGLLGTATVFRITVSGGGTVTLTGLKILAYPVPRFAVIVLIPLGGTLVLKNADAGSLLINRFGFTGGDQTITAGNNITLLYDNSASNIWRRIASGG